MQGSGMILESKGGSIAMFAVSMYLLLYYYYFRKYFLDSLLNEISFYFSSWGNKVQNICYITITALLYLVYIVVATIVNHSSSSVSLILTIDLVRLGYLGFHLARGKKQVSFPTSVALRNLLLSLLTILLIFFFLLYKVIEPAIILLVLYVVYLILVITHETITEYVILLFNRPHYENRRGSEEVYLAIKNCDIEREMDDFKKLLDKAHVPDHQPSLTFAPLFFTVKNMLKDRDNELVANRDQNFIMHVAGLQDREEQQQIVLIKTEKEEIKKAEDVVGLEYGENQDSVSQLREGNQQVPASDERMFLEYFFYPFVVAIELINQLDKFRNLGKMLVTVVVILAVIMLAVGVSSLQANFNVPGQFLGIILGVLCCLEYKYYVESCFEVTPYDIFNTNLEESVVRCSLGLGIGLVGTAANTGSLNSNPGYVIFLLVMMLGLVILLVYVATNHQSFVKEKTGYVMLGIAGVGMVTQVVFSWVEVRIV